jgi:hypothetical protein
LEFCKILELNEEHLTDFLQLHNSSFEPVAWPSRNITLGDLRSATTYDVRFVAEYPSSLPSDLSTTSSSSSNSKEPAVTEQYFPQALQIRTKAGTPSAPQDVRLELDENSGEERWTLKWRPPLLDGGEKILTYAVEYRLKIL